VPPRLFLPQSFVPGAVVTLPAAASRHVQVLRLQPGDGLTLFNGSDGADWAAEIVAIGRREVELRVGAARLVDRELDVEVTIALGVPANDRMDALIEKAGELGAAAIQPLVCERSVVRLAGDRAEARRAHWQAVAAAASEQCGRTRVTQVRALATLPRWFESMAAGGPERRAVLSLAPSALAPARVFGAGAAALEGGAARPSVVLLSGPEGGLTADEEARAVALGFQRLGLGPRVLRADTAPLALLAWLGLRTARMESPPP
jgi:16S rRNA (uracil1498-N3)-methyltransferase